MVISNRKSPAKIETRYNDTVLEQVNTFPYLGITLNNKGNFEQNKINMINKCTKAFYKLWRSSKNANLSVKSLFHLYDHTIKPILVYGSEVTFTFNLKKRMKDRFREHWKVRLMSNISKNGTPSTGNKLRTYRKFKNIYKCEPYLEMNSHNLRKNFCRFRISAHNLNIETGRHKNIPLKERLCTKCNLLQVEDEVHALVICPFYDPQRQTLFETANNSSPHFSQLPAEAKFTWLMSNEDGSIIYTLANFISSNFFTNNKS